MNKDEALKAILRRAVEVTHPEYTSNDEEIDAYRDALDSIRYIAKDALLED